MNPRIRFAPSPTGSLHIGGARTALFNYLFAQNQNGSLVLRVEDTDIERNTTAALKSQLADLNWLGISWDEGVNLDGISEAGKFGPYKQSQRLDIYQKYLNQMLESGLAYYCFLTTTEIEQEKQQCIKKGLPYRPQSKYRDLSLNEAKKLLTSNPHAVIRFKSPNAYKTYTIQDIVRGEVVFSSEQAGDFVIMRSNNMPMYNFCCVIDDHLMQISHVFRGEEHLTNTLKQLMLYDALNFTPPKFAHTSIIMSTNGKKLSKRDGAVACDHYKSQGYLPEAVINYIALLGWNDGSEQELFSTQELIEKFSLNRLNSSSPIFDAKKLTWINSKHIQNISAKKLWQNLSNYLDAKAIPSNYPTNWGELFSQAFAENFNTLLDAEQLFQLLTVKQLNFQVGTEVLLWENSIQVISLWLQELESLTTEQADAEWLAASTKKIQNALNIKGKLLFMPLRVAMLSQPQGAELKLLVKLLPKQTLINRAKDCLSYCKELSCT